ncbi:MAG: family 16 glycosylhydrolase [Verrucomicrobiota bacterium]
MSKLKLITIAVAVFGLLFEGAVTTEAGWSKVRRDAFNSWNSSYWSKSYPWGNGFSNTPKTYYSPNNVWVSGGSLNLKASGVNWAGKEWTGAACNSFQKIERSYDSRWLARVKVPHRNGVNPAFWLAASDRQWPPEIDIFESPGGVNSGGKRAYMTLHFPGGGKSTSTWTASTQLGSKFRIYEVQWRYSSVKWYIDGVQRKSYTTTSKIPHETMYALFSMEVGEGSGWWGTPQLNNWESVMKVDYFEMYRWQ